jgi:hypothetical protein
MFELGMQDEEIKLVSEEHYELVPAANITAEDLEIYSRRKKV